MAVYSGKFEKVVVILSTGRTGTMSLAHHLDACYPQVRAVHEPSPSRRLRIASNRYLCGRLSRQDIIDRFVAARRRFFAGVSEPIYVESNNFLHGFQDAFDELFDRPLVLHIVRDVRTFIRSWVNFGVYRGLKGLAGRYYPYWLLKPELRGRDGGAKWLDMQPLVRLAWYWSAINAELNRGEQLFGERYLRLRFEDVFSDDGAVMNEVLNWVGMPKGGEKLERPAKEKVNASRDAGCPRWQDWSGDVLSGVMAEAAPLMKLYGYIDGE